jgi:hypothetical protein
MASVAEILKQYRLVGAALTVNRTEIVPGSAPAQIRDAGQSILAWDKDEYLTGAPSDEVIAQVKAVRAQLPEAGADWKLVSMASTLPFMTGVGKKGAAGGPGCDRSKCVMFTDSSAYKKTISDEIDVDCQSLHATWQAETEPAKKTAARVLYMKTMAFKHLMNGREGPASAVNTYDDAIFTWGMGYGANGGLPAVLANIIRIEKAASPDDLEKHHVQKLFYLCGFKFDGRYWAVDVPRKKVIVSAGADATAADSAFRTIHDDFDFHKMWVLAARDPLTRKTIVDAQRDVFFKATGNVANAEKIQTAALYTFLAHLQHWTGDTQMGMVDWALGGSARPRVKVPLPSEEGDALIAVQAVHRFYWKRSPDYNANPFVQVRKYWKEMTGEDTRDEALTIFRPSYPIMTAAPVASVPADHLGGTLKDGTFYDLGPLADFSRMIGPPTVMEAEGEEKPELPPEESEGSHWRSMPIVPAPPPRPVEQPSWWRRILF